MEMIVLVIVLVFFVGAQGVGVERLKHKGGEDTITMARVADLDLVVLAHCHDRDEDDKDKEPCKGKDSKDGEKEMAWSDSVIDAVKRKVLRSVLWGFCNDVKALDMRPRSGRMFHLILLFGGETKALIEGRCGKEISRCRGSNAIV